MLGGWESLFPTVKVFKKPRELCDHNPLVVSTQQLGPGKMKEFRFELAWLKDPDYLLKVQEI
jgi:hypothetical protein